MNVISCIRRRMELSITNGLVRNKNSMNPFNQGALLFVVRTCKFNKIIIIIHNFKKIANVHDASGIFESQEDCTPYTCYFEPMYFYVWLKNSMTPPCPSSPIKQPPQATDISKAICPQIGNAWKFANASKMKPRKHIRPEVFLHHHQ